MSWMTQMQVKATCCHLGQMAHRRRRRRWGCCAELDSCDGDGQRNVQGGVYFSAFQAALDGSHKAVVWLLLEKDVDVNVWEDSVAVCSRQHWLVVMR